MRRWSVMMLGLVCVVMSPWSSFAQSADWLGKGNISVKTRAMKNTDNPEVIVKAVIDAPPQKVWKIVADCSRYKQTMSRIASRGGVAAKNSSLL